MPHRGMGLQDLVNKWVKVNKAHVVFLDASDDERFANELSSMKYTNGGDVDISSSRREIQCYDGVENGHVLSAAAVSAEDSSRRRRKQRAVFDHADENSSVAMKTVATASTAMSYHTEGSKKHSDHHMKQTHSKRETMGAREVIWGGTDGMKRSGMTVARHLRRTNSQSDLLKQKFEEAHEEPKSGRRRRQFQKDRRDSKDSISRSVRSDVPDSSGTPSGSLKWVASFFSKDSGSSTKTGSSWAKHHEAYLDAADGITRGSFSSTSSKQKSRWKKNRDKNSPKQPLPTLSRSCHTRPGDASEKSLDNFQCTNDGSADLSIHPSLSNLQSHCDNCQELEKQVNMMAADIEYLRLSAVQNEFACSNCHKDMGNDNHSSSVVNKEKYSISSTGSINSNNSHCSNHVNDSASLTESSYRLKEITNRHKRQIEQMTRERARWQNDMHLKLSKFALMCKELNEESAIRKQDATAVKAEIDEVKADRDALASEVAILRAKLSLHEKEQKDNEQLRDTLSNRDNETLNQADTAIQKRDTIICELAKRLEATMHTLETERQVQRQRRIIFPVSKTLLGQTVDDDSSAMRDLKGQLLQAKDATNMAQNSLNDAVAEATKREEILMAKCQKLEQQLLETAEVNNLTVKTE